MNWALLAVGAVDWASLERQASVVDREVTKAKPVITPFCGEGDAATQFIGWSKGRRWVKIRIFADGQPYTVSVADHYPALGYTRVVRENISNIAEGPSWEEYRWHGADGQKRRAATQALLREASWKPVLRGEEAGLVEQIAEGQQQLSRDWRVLDLGGTRDGVISVAHPRNAQLPCFLPVTPERIRQFPSNPGRRKVLLELRSLRPHGAEGVLTSVE